MASDLGNLTNNQLNQVDNIVDIGNELGLDNILIETEGVQILCQRHRLRYFSSRSGKWIVS